MKKEIVLLFAVFLLLSCEEEVILDLRKIDKAIVVEATLLNPMGTVRVNLSYSQGFYDTISVETLDEATVYISGSDLPKTPLSNIGNGVYTTINLPVKSAHLYTIWIENEGKTIEATTVLPPVVAIGQVVQVANPFSGSDSINLITNFMDLPGQDNYFRLKVNKKGRKPSTEYFLVDDSFGKDGIISAPVYYKNFAKGDTVIIELFHLSKTTWGYYSGLSENQGGSFNSVSPGNPESNMPEGVMGYFAGLGYAVDTVVVQGLPNF